MYQNAVAPVKLFVGSGWGRMQPCDDWSSILYLDHASAREILRRKLCQRQLLLQKRNEPQRCRKIFCRSKEQITSNFTSVTPSRRRIFIKVRSVFSRWLIADRKPVCESAP